MYSLTFRVCVMLP